MARILLIDDDEAGIELRRLIFERLGHQLACARTAPDAEAAFHSFHPNIVLMDLRLPEAAEGLFLIRNFRASSAEVKIIVLCGHPPDIENTPEAGLVNAILAKPIRTEHLIATLSASRASLP